MAFVNGSPSEAHSHREPDHVLFLDAGVVRVLHVQSVQVVARLVSQEDAHLLKLKKHWEYHRHVEVEKRMISLGKQGLECVQELVGAEQTVLRLGFGIQSFLYIQEYEPYSRYYRLILNLEALRML